MIEVRVRTRNGTFQLDFDATSSAMVTGIFGDSGAGKTTLFHAVAGLTPIEAGRIRVGDEVLVDTERGIELDPARRKIGVVFQEGRLFPHLDVRRNLLYGAERAAGGTGGPRLEDVVDLLEIDALLARRTSQLSGGERQRVALGRALLSSPRLLLCDEPLAALDARRRTSILPFLRRVRDEYSIPMLYISHDLPEILELTDELWLIESGRKVDAGSVSKLLESPSAREQLVRSGIVNVFRALNEAGSNRARIGSQELRTARVSRDGTPSIVRIRPEDIAIARSAPSDASFQNVLPATIASCAPIEHGSLLVLEIGSEHWISEVTRDAVDRLVLEGGTSCFALVKANAIRSAPLHPPSRAAQPPIS